MRAPPTVMMREFQFTHNTFHICGGGAGLIRDSKEFCDCGEIRIDPVIGVPNQVPPSVSNAQCESVYIMIVCTTIPYQAPCDHGK
jgi:hypothetical protein